MPGLYDSDAEENYARLFEQTKALIETIDDITMDSTEKLATLVWLAKDRINDLKAAYLDVQRELSNLRENTSEGKKLWEVSTKNIELNGGSKL